MKKSSKNAVYYFRDSNAYFDTRSVLLHVKWYAYKDDDQALEANDKVTFCITLYCYILTVIACKRIILHILFINIKGFVW